MPVIVSLTNVSLSLVFVTVFVVGLVLAVYVMLYGVERAEPPRPDAPHLAAGGYDPRTEPSTLVNWQNAAAFLVAFGLVGYAVHRATALGTAGSIIAAVLGGVAGVVLSVVLLAGWALPSARRDVVDARYLMQGHPATVTAPIAAGAAGEIVYEADGRRWTVRARSFDDAPIAAGSEVAIDRIEDGVAYVEQWGEVEARL